VDDSAKLYLESESAAARAPVTIDNYEVVWTRGVAHEWTFCLQVFGRDGGPSRHGIVAGNSDTSSDARSWPLIEVREQPHRATR
jgi:hypothetical protein